MNILLLNDNPVVNKLVTLSAQKTSDDLDVVNTVDTIEKESYDLLVIDDTLYNNDVFTQIKQKTSFKKSLYICSRDAEIVDTFDTVLKKPFLPTDLVELFSYISKEVATMNIVNDDEPLMMIEDDFEDNIGEEINLNIETTESILDNDEAQKVKELLDETSDEFEDLDDELDLSDIDLTLSTDNDIMLNDDEDEDEEIEFDLKDSVELEDEDEAMLEEEPELELEDSLEIESEDVTDDEEELDIDLELEESLELESEDDAMIEEEPEPEIELEESLEIDSLDIEDQIKTAVSELSEEDLEEAVSEETLLEIAETEINSLDSLTSRDLKLAIGEEVEELKEEIIVEQTQQEEIQDAPTTNGVEALKNLLSALTDKNVAASMQGMKISINITLGDS